MRVRVRKINRNQDETLRKAEATGCDLARRLHDHIEKVAEREASKLTLTGVEHATLKHSIKQQIAHSLIDMLIMGADDGDPLFSEAILIE